MEITTKVFARLVFRRNKVLILGRVASTSPTLGVYCGTRTYRYSITYNIINKLIIIQFSTNTLILSRSHILTSSRLSTDHAAQPRVSFFPNWLFVASNCCFYQFRRPLPAALSVSFPPYIRWICETIASYRRLTHTTYHSLLYLVSHICGPPNISTWYRTHVFMVEPVLTVIIVNFIICMLTSISTNSNLTRWLLSHADNACN